MVSERAQLLLVGSVLIASTVVATVILLNSIYAPADLQTDDVEDDAEHVDRLHDELHAALEQLFLEMDSRSGTQTPFVTETLNPAASINETFQENVSGTLGPAYARAFDDRRASTVRVSFVPEESVRGWAIYQRDGTTFESSPAGPGANWTVADSDPSLVKTRLEVREFVDSEGVSLTVNNSTASWHLNVTEGDVVVNTPRGGVRALCRVGRPLSSYDRVVVDSTGDRGSVGLYEGGHLVHRCGDFDVAPDVGSTRALRFVDGDNVRGNYTVTGTGGGPRRAFAPAYENPNNTIVDPAFRVTYVSAGVTYESEFTLYNRTEP